MSLSKQELFDRIRRDSWQQQVSIRALSRKDGVHRRLVREALALPVPVPKPRKQPARTSPRMEPYKKTVDDWLRADLEAPRKPWQIVGRHGTPLAVTLTGGNRHDVTQLLPLLDVTPPIRGLRGRPRRRPRRLFADRGYDYDKYRRILRRRGITPRIARRGLAHGSGLGKTRWVVERTFAWLHQFKRLRIRYEIRADLHQGLLQLACSIICLRQLKASC